MTAQMPDQFVLNDHVYSIVGIKGGELFRPREFGLNPVTACTACWRGHVCQYGIENDRLVLDKLQIALGHFRENGLQLQQGPEINGVRPVAPGGKYALFNNVYEGLSLEMKFTGGVLIADGFIQELYVHMGFHPAWKYRTVFELIFDKGGVVEIRDVSKKMAELRSEMIKRPMSPGLEAGDQRIESWVKSTFSLDYNL